MHFAKPIPVLRIFDESKAKEFYVDYLGFKVDWEYRPEADAPLYMQISLGECVIHLTEHYGDCSPGGSIRIETLELDAYHQQLTAKQYKYFRPGIQQEDWGKDMSINDPFGNRLIFNMLTGHA